MVPNAKADEQNQRHMEHEIHGMISKLTAIGKSAARSGEEDEEADDGVRLITLAGDNKGATMKANLEEIMDIHGALHDEEKEMSVYANSDHQAVNNSILLGGSCTADDPGVHMVISGYADEHGDGHQESHGKKKKEEKKKKDRAGGGVGRVQRRSVEWG